MQKSLTLIDFNDILEVFKEKKSQNTAVMDYLCYCNSNYVNTSV